MKAIFAAPTILALVYRAWSHKSLTPAGIAIAFFTAIAHAVHPWSLPFVLLVVFFLAGTRVTKVKKDIKEKLTIQSTGNSGGEGPRTHIQVLANSGVASLITLLSAYQHWRRSDENQPDCYPWRSDLLIVGIIANYAAVAADTFSSELGILSSSEPRLITSLGLRKVPKGTNGGVTLWGLTAGLLGSFIIVITAVGILPFCGLSIYGVPFDNHISKEVGKPWDLVQVAYFTSAMIIWGALGSVLDSILGGLLQQSIVDTRTGRVVEGDGGKRVLVSTTGANSIHLKESELKTKVLNREGKDTIPKPADNIGGYDQRDRHDRYDVTKKMRKSSFGDGVPSRSIVSGIALLDNNDVNFLMALTMSLGAMAIAGWVWDVPLSSIFAI